MRFTQASAYAEGVAHYSEWLRIRCSRLEKFMEGTVSRYREISPELAWAYYQGQNAALFHGPQPIHGQTSVIDTVPVPPAHGPLSVEDVKIRTEIHAALGVAV